MKKRCYVSKKLCDVLLNVETVKRTSASEASLFFQTAEETNVNGTRRKWRKRFNGVIQN